jgi:hypothetical protein
VKKFLVTLILLLVGVSGLPAAAATAGSVEMSATVNGQDISTATTDDPVRLDPGSVADVSIRLTNHTERQIHLRRVVLGGDVLGLTFFSYGSTVDVTVAPGATEVISYRLDLADLGKQATGLINGGVTVKDQANEQVAQMRTVVDIRGSLLSVYGLFGIALVVLTLLALLDAALAITHHRLEANRFQRGVRLMIPGIGIGLVIAFSASVARIWVPSVAVWPMVAGATAAAFFAIGYFAPTPQSDDEDDECVDEFDDFQDPDDDDPPTARHAATARTTERLL